MKEVTNEDREHELRSLLDEMQKHPERDWTEARKRIAVLRQVLDTDTAAPNG
ncbi:MAG: hypothetical protein PHE36_04130 [Novosphingobium sp.]|nr:hypothetical protein [Novosphingobium sp.]